MSNIEPLSQRMYYLRQLLLRNQNITLPIASIQATVPLQTVFQPLMLLNDPLLLQKDGQEMKQQDEEDLFQEDQQQKKVVVNNGIAALEKSPQRRMVVLGGPGMGKTTMLKDLLQQAIHQAQQDEQAPLPIFISLPDLARSGQTFREYSSKLVTELGLEQGFTSSLIAAIEQGQAFLCLDSLDEVLPALRTNMITMLNRDALRYGGTWIIGSRFTEYKGGQFAHSQFAEWELQLLDDQTQIQLAAQVLSALHAILHTETENVPEPSAKIFIHMLKHDTQTKSWAQTPLLLSLAAVVYAQTGKLPARRVQLYNEAIETMLSMRITEQAERQQLRLLLAELSLQLYQTHGRNFTFQELQTLLPPHITALSSEEQQTLLTQLLDSGIFETVAYQTYGFKHQTFQEYLAAVALAQQLCSNDDTLYQHSWEFIWSKHLYSRWNEILRLLVGVLTHDYGEQGIHIVVRWLTRLADERESAEGDIGNLCLFLALYSLQELNPHIYQAELATLESKLLQAWAEEDEKSRRGNHWDKLSAVAAELELSAVLPFFQTLESQNKTWHYYPRSGNTTIHFYLPSSLLKATFEDLSHIRLTECYLIDTWNDDQRLQKLLSFYAEATEVKLHEAVIGLLGHIQRPATLEFLLALLAKTDEKYEIRLASAQALKQQQDHVPLSIFNSLYKDKESAIRAIAISVIGQKDTFERAQKFLYTECQHTEDELTFLAALNVCAQRKILPPISALTRVIIIWDDEDNETEESIKSLFTEHHRTIPIEPFLPFLHDTDGYNSFFAIEVLELLEERVSNDVWIDVMLHSLSDSVQEKAAKILAKRGYTYTPEVLFQMLNIAVLTPITLHNIAHLKMQLPLDHLLELLNQNLPVHNEARWLEISAVDVPTEPILKALYRPDIQKQPATCRALISLLLKQKVEPPQDALQAIVNQVPTSWRQEKSYAKLITFLASNGFKLDWQIIMRAAIYDTNGDGKLLLSTFPQFESSYTITTLLYSLDAQFASIRRGHVFSHLFYHLYEWITPELLFSTLNNTASDQYLACLILAATNRFPEEFICQYLKSSNQNAAIGTLFVHLCNENNIMLPLDVLLTADTWISDARITPLNQKMLKVSDVLMQAFSLYQERDQEAALTSLIAHSRHTFSAFSVEALKHLADLLPDTFLLELLSDADPERRQYGIQIAAAFKARAPQQRLLEILHDPSENSEAKYYVFQTLGNLGGYISLDPLLEMATGSNRDFQHQAWEALLTIVKQSNKEIAPARAFSLLDSPDDIVVHGALQLLEAMIEHGQDLPSAPFISLLSSKDNIICRYAASSLCKMGSKAPIQSILQIMETVSYTSKISIIEKFQYLKDQAPCEILLDNLNDYYARTALDTLARTAPQKLVTLSKKYHELELVREKIQSALQTMLKDNLDITPYVHMTQAALTDQETRVRQAAYVTMGMGSQYFSPEPLLQALKEEDEKIQRTALQALAAFGSRVPVEAIMPLLGETEMGPEALETLRQTHPEVLSTLVLQAEAILRLEALPAPFAARPYYRIAETVGHIKKATPAVLEMLTNLLNYPQWEVQKQAARALGAIRRNIPDTSIRALMTLRRTSERQSVRQTADTALGEILSIEQGMEGD